MRICRCINHTWLVARRIILVKARDLEAWLVWAEGPARVMDPLSGSLEALYEVARPLR
jgi:hypothetical protein